ncbi:MAG: acyl-CoA desaturase [Acidobacteriota bacterium]
MTSENSSTLSGRRGVSDRWPWLRTARTWLATAQSSRNDPDPGTGVHWSRFVPFVFLHAGILGVIAVGWSPVAAGVAAVLVAARIFFLTAFYHRYFSHRAYKTSRVAQFIFAVLGNTAIQKGPLWWAAHHRQHHRTADQEGDLHSPHRTNLYWSHIGWLTRREHFTTRMEMVPDLAVFPELRWLDRYDGLVVLLYGAALFGLGATLNAVAPGLGTSGFQMLIWGFFVSTVALFHVTNMVNSVAHTFGKRHFPSPDQSRNSMIIALLTFGEGWHNNHHYYPAAARQGFLWWEVDLTYYLLRLMAAVGLIWDLNEVPAHIMARRDTLTPAEEAVGRAV